MSVSTDTQARPGDADRYRVLLEIGHKLAATLSQDELYEAIYEETARAVEATGFYIALYDQSRDLAHIVFFADGGQVQHVDISYRGSDSTVIRDREPSLTNSGLGDGQPLLVLGDEGQVTVAGMTAPLIRHGRVIGVISAQSYEPDAYSGDDLQLFGGIADLAAVAIENALQFAELERRRLEAEKIQEIGLALTSELDPELVLGKVVGAALQLLEVEGAAVWLTDGSGDLILRVAESGGAVSLPIGLEWQLEGEAEQKLVHDRAPHVVESFVDEDMPPHLREYLTTGSSVSVPIEVNNEFVGALGAGSRHARGFDKYDIAILHRLARQSSIALRNARLHANLHALSITDPLTHLPNRRRLQIHLDHEVAAARRGRALGLAVFDLDNFKHYNDTFGHVAGDQILRAFAEVLIQENRAMNVVARFGGDEFVAVLTDTTFEGVRSYVERVEARVSTDEVLSKFGISVSAGTAVFDPDNMATVNDLLRCADAEMYAQKAARAAGREKEAHERAQ